MNVVVVKGVVSLLTIEINVNEIRRLHKEFLDRSPCVSTHQAYELQYHTITQCCPDEEEILYTIYLFIEGQFNEKYLANGTKIAKASLSSSHISTHCQLI